MLTETEPDSDSQAAVVSEEVEVDRLHLTFSDMMTIIGPVIGFTAVATSVFSFLCCVFYHYKKRRTLKPKPYGNKY